MKANIKAILFDLGNVLVHYDSRRSSKAFSKALGISEEEIWLAFFTSDAEKAYTTGHLSSKEFYEKVSNHFPNKLDYETFSEFWNDIFTENHEMKDLLARLKKNYPLYLISNTNDLHFEYIQRTFSILSYFDRCFPSHQVGFRKPDSNIFRHVLEDIHLRPEETIFIDDIPEFVYAAKRVGIHGIQFASRSQLEKDLLKFGISF